MVQGDSPLSRPTEDNQYSTWGALSVVSPVIGIRGLPGSRQQGSGHAFSRGTPHRAAPGGLPSSASRAEGRSAAGRCPQQTLQPAPPLQGGPAFKASAGRCVPLNLGPRPQPGGEPLRSRPAPGRTSPPEAAPGAAAALKPLRSRRPLTCNAPTREAPRHSVPRPRPPAGPRPPRSPKQPQSLGGPLQGGKTAPPRSPRPQQSSHSALDTGPPASARPGTDLKSAPPEPIR
ncbi:hypothetical protein NDU88_001865 [Pleurodeles waltl]|uniref:Basic proline-rich protein-like n=1 Tax=Pleurodeles waltl TaxID=8319 RepID=A0AAV7NKD6_PLEWA|nr:hypothetical protein NDU88_001865 [Pleurodeles waltl]